MSDLDLTVYHNGSCPLCRLEIGHYRKQPGAERIRFVDVSDDAISPGPGLNRAEALGRFTARLPTGELKSGSAAFIEIWKLLPRWQPAATAARLPGATLALEIGYRAFSPLRPKLARIVARLGLA